MAKNSKENRLGTHKSYKSYIVEPEEQAPSIKITVEHKGTVKSYTKFFRSDKEKYGFISVLGALIHSTEKLGGIVRC
ncbi:hypothetical protein ACTWQB_01985 [Piscibacillus sp. B03]|uniref:hypothetical protein n=1 Tax=Piscibacillus sp. B03 TaxID=3457430 RepID=UPI003FCE5484